MGPIPNNLERLQEQLGNLLVELSLHEDQSPVVKPDDPLELISAFGQVFEFMTRLETNASRDPKDSSPETVQNVTEIGEYALRLLDKSAQLLLPSEPTRAEQLALLNIGFVHWVLRHQGHLHPLEPVVNDLAMLANRCDDPVALAELARVMLDIIDHAGPHYKQDLEAYNPWRPWRRLHLNLGIVATRARRADLVDQAYERLVRHLPQDAPRFFHQDMQQLQFGDAPESVRAVMSRDFQHWGSKPALH